MPWKKNSAEAVAVLDRAMDRFACQRRVMFGGPAYFVNGNMFAGLHQDNVMLRLSESDRESLLSTRDEAAPFEPMEGRPMREYAVLPESLYADPALLGEWLDRAFRYASSLPPREPKVARRR